MKFSEMPYERPDVEGLKKEITEFTESLKNADTYEEARDIFVRKELIHIYQVYCGILVEKMFTKVCS